MGLRFVGCLIFLLLFSHRAVAQCAIASPYEQGVYASQLFDFVPGYWIKLYGPMATHWGEKSKQKRRLHMSRLINPARRVLGCPKTTLEGSLTLGHGGFVIVGPSKCFRNGKGPDLLLHEPRSDINWNEAVNVYVTPDEAGKGPWFKIAANRTVDQKNNFLELELDGIVSERGVPIEEFRWVKVEDANSQFVLSNQRFSGFDVSAVKFLHECHLPMSGDFGRVNIVALF